MIYSIPYDLTAYSYLKYRIISVYGAGYLDHYSCRVISNIDLNRKSNIIVKGYSDSSDSNQYPNASLSVIVVLQKIL